MTYCINGEFRIIQRCSSSLGKLYDFCKFLDYNLVEITRYISGLSSWHMDPFVPCFFGARFTNTSFNSLRPSDAYMRR